MPLGMNEINHKKNIKEPKTSQTENLLGGLQSTEVSSLLLTQQPKFQFPAFLKIFHRKNYPCCWDWLTTLVREKWTLAWKCWSNHQVLAGASQFYNKDLISTWIWGILRNVLKLDSHDSGLTSGRRNEAGTRLVVVEIVGIEGDRRVMRGRGSVFIGRADWPAFKKVVVCLSLF